jgi:NADH-quinone oxidoreductase subunit L
MMRAYCLTFIGETRLQNKILKMVHEAPSVMIYPVTLLSLLSIGGGFLGFSCGPLPILESFLSEIGVSQAERELTTTCYPSFFMLLAIFAAFFGIISAYLIYRLDLSSFLKPIQVLKNSFYIDDFYQVIFVKPLKNIATVISKFLEPKIFDRMITAFTNLAKSASYGLQKFQSGQIRSYIAWMVVGMALMIAYFII